MTIAFKEKLNMPPPVINALIEGSGSDIRQVVNMLSASKLDQEAMDFDKGKAMSKAWEKHIILKPWDIVGKILGGGMWAESSKATLNEKSELYFNDHEFSYLMLQENYLGTIPIKASSYSGKVKNLKMLELASNAADSISDGDLVDRMIHGSQQQWSLMPTHAMFSFVRPASFVAGAFQGYGSTRFTSWLGQNSKLGKFSLRSAPHHSCHLTQLPTGKLSRFVKEIQGHMRLRSTGDRHEIRQQYIPALWSSLVQKLQLEGKEAVPEIIKLMDSYFLTRDDWDAILELGVGRMDVEKIKIESQAKSTFTRLYNQQSHPMPFMKASAVVAPAKIAREKPDLEEAVEASDDEAGNEPDVNEKLEGEEEEELDLKKDKYIKAPKKKAAPKKAAGVAKGKGKGKKVVDDDGDDDEEMEMESEEEKPKAKKGKGKAKK
jgi:replication factor C subunit 1